MILAFLRRHNKDEQQTDAAKAEVDKERVIAKAMMDKQFDHLFALMNDTLHSITPAEGNLPDNERGQDQ